MVSVEDYLVDIVFLGCIVGLVVNCIVQVQFEVDGVSYLFDKNDGEYCLYSGFCGFYNKIWNVFGILMVEGCELCFVVKYGYLEGGFLGNKQVEVCYFFGYDNIFWILFYVEFDFKILISLINYVYFNLVVGGDVLSYYLQLCFGVIILVMDMLIMMKDFMLVVNIFFDFELVKIIGKVLVSDYI